MDQTDEIMSQKDKQIEQFEKFKSKIHTQKNEEEKFPDPQDSNS